MYESRHGDRARAGVGAGEKYDPGGICFCDLTGDGRNGLLPGGGRELPFPTVARALHRAAQPVGVIQGLHGGMAARTEPAAAHRVQRVAFHLLDGGNALAELLARALDGAHALHDAHQSAATGCAFGACSGVPLLFPRHDFAFRDQQRNQLIGLAATASESRGRRRQNFDKPASVHGLSPVPSASLVMTCRAILRCLVLTMTAQARAHGVLDQPLGNGGLGHVSMARGALDLRPGVRRMLKLHQRFAREAIHTLPGNLPLAVGVCHHLLHFRVRGAHLGVTEHALPDRRNARGRAGVRGDMAIQAL